jgi:hypothetical protein
MARSRTPRPPQTDSRSDYDRQKDPRSAREGSPRAFSGKFNQPPTEAHRAPGHDNENLVRALNQVRFGGNGNDEIDYRTRQLSSFKPIGNCGKNADGRTTSSPPAHAMAATSRYLIYARYVSL